MTDGDGRPDLDALIEHFEEDVRKRPLPAEGSTAPETTTVPTTVGSPMPAEVVEQIRAELAEPIEPAAPVPAPAGQGSPRVTAFLAPPDIAAWWASGERIRVEVPGGRYEIFARVVGEGPWLTTLHGFPTSSWDWVPMLPQLATGHRVLLFDLLGFGDSDKPRDHDWSAFEQADIVEALWRHFGIAETRVLAHDVGLTVSLELLARQEDGKLGARINDLVLLNGGAYTGFHRPRPIQVWLQRPVVGALIARMLSEGRFGPALAEVFGPGHQPSVDELHQHWLSVARRLGSRNYHRLIRYIPERRANAGRWESALEKSPTPVRFVWGMADPVSGAHMAAVIRERNPAADIVELDGVGHYPQIEAPAAVAGAVLEPR